MFSGRATGLSADFTRDLDSVTFFQMVPPDLTWIPRHPSSPQANKSSGPAEAAERITEYPAASNCAFALFSSVAPRRAVFLAKRLLCRLFR